MFACQEVPSICVCLLLCKFNELLLAYLLGGLIASSVSVRKYSLQSAIIISCLLLSWAVPNKGKNVHGNFRLHKGRKKMWLESPLPPQKKRKEKRNDTIYRRNEKGRKRNIGEKIVTKTK